MALGPAAGPGEPAVEPVEDDGEVRRARRQELIVDEVPVHELPRLRRLVDRRRIGPNLTHLASRTTFASGYFELNRGNLVDWMLDAPGR